ncbi:TRAP transporter large permease subunit [Microbacterium sp. NM3R9]|uniref:TRAP transporter large permease subunit n=1 Tax=Microbacterium thalli TaxID=3027921 RepID=UPI0023661B01|nr:TRAP transporter large permease subunit [Microbacterium thalli]MDD7928291.1 TRAP transporter large permease subunit [Microbacterium thalli]MDN8548894.1 TRAP transporter large permease subunit [Microbacterium thalli]
MGLAVWALIAYIGVIVVWSVVVKRGIGEAMIVGFVVVCAFGGPQFLEMVSVGLQAAFDQEIVFAALAFTFIGFLLASTGVIDRQVDILNSLLGRLRGGAGYVATVGSALFGAVAHSGSANAATMGSVAIPWMKRSNWPPHVAATVVAGNAGNGTVIPPSASFFILIGTATVAPFVVLDELLLAMFAAAGWCVLWRLIVIFVFVRRHKIGRVDAADILPFGRSFRSGWTSLLVFLGILIPVLVTLGPSGEAIGGVIGADAMEAISLIVWMPVLLLIFAVVLGWRRLPRGGRAWYAFVAKTAPRYRDIGATLVFAFAGGAVLTELGLADQLSAVLNGLNASPVVMSIIVAVMVVLVAGPLSSTATIATIGGIGFSVLMVSGVDPILAACVVLVAASTEGASPPGASAIYIATGIAQVNPVKTFVPLVVWYVLPILAIAALIGPGWLPVPH